MITIYIKELDNKLIKYENEPKLLKKIIYRIINVFNIIQVEEIENNRKIYLIPNINKINVYKRINKKLLKEETKTQKVQVVLSKEIEKYKDKFLNYKIIDGENIFTGSIENIIEKVIGDNRLELQDIYVTTNYYIDNNINIIKNLSAKVKSINIVTKEIEKYKILEEIMQEKGIVVSVSNNKKKSLKKSKIIINLDFTEEKLNEYILNRNAIIVNIKKNRMTKLKNFEGIIIKEIDIELDKKEKSFKRENRLDNFKNVEIYESLKNRTYRKDEINISRLYGNNGEILEKELKKWQENLIVKN